MRLLAAVMTAITVVSSLAVLVATLLDDTTFLYIGLTSFNTAILARRFAVSISETNNDPFNPAAFFAVGFGFYMVIYPLLIPLLGLNLEEYIPSLIMTLVGLIAFEVGFVIFLWPPRKTQKREELNYNVLVMLPILILSMAPVFVFLGIHPAGVSYAAPFFALVVHREFRNLWSIIYFWLIFLSAMMIIYGTFGRATIAQTILLLTIFYHYYFRKFSISQTFVLSLIGLFALAWYVFFRQVIRDPSYTGSLVGMTVELIQFYALVSSDLTFLGIALVALDFPIIYEAYNTVATKVPTLVDYTYGAEYAKIFLWFVPRWLYPDKPLSIATLYVHTFLPGSSEKQSTGPSFIGELYWNFGYPGVIVGMMMLGMLVKYLYQNYRDFQRSYFAFGMYATVMLTLPVLMRGATATNLVLLLQLGVFPLLIGFGLLKVFKRRKGTGNGDRNKAAAPPAGSPPVYHRDVGSSPH